MSHSSTHRSQVKWPNGHNPARSGTTKVVLRPQRSQLDCRACSPFLCRRLLPRAALTAGGNGEGSMDSLMMSVGEVGAIEEVVVAQANLAAAAASAPTFTQSHAASEAPEKGENGSRAGLARHTSVRGGRAAELPRFAVFAGPDPARRGSMFGASEHESWGYEPSEREAKAWGTISRRNSVSRRESRGYDGLASRGASFNTGGDNQASTPRRSLATMSGPRRMSFLGGGSRRNINTAAATDSTGSNWQDRIGLTPRHKGGMKHHSPIGDEPGSPHVKYKVLWEDSPDSLSEQDVRGSPHAAEVEHSGPSLSRFAAARNRVEPSQSSQLGQGDYPSMRDVMRESASGDGHTPLISRSLLPSSTRRFSEDIMARRRAMAGISSTNLDKRRTSMGLVERIKSVTLALTERKRSTVAEELTVAAGKDSDSEDSEAHRGRDLVWDEDGNARRKVWWRRWRFRHVVIPFLLCACFNATAVLLLLIDPHVKAIHVPMWRWAFFLGWAIPMYRITRVAMYLLLAALEFRFLISRRFIYYTIGIKRWTSLLLLVGLLMSLYAGLIQSYAQRSMQPADVKKAYLYILRIMGCLLLLSCANVAKTLIAKILSCHFYCSGYFDKMQDALRKEYLLVALSQPRADEEHDVLHQTTTGHGALNLLKGKLFTGRQGHVTQRLSSIIATHHDEDLKKVIAEALNSSNSAPSSPTGRMSMRASASGGPEGTVLRRSASDLGVTDFSRVFADAREPETPEAPRSDLIKPLPGPTNSKRSLLAPGPVMGQVIEEADEEGEEEEEELQEAGSQQGVEGSQLDLHVTEPGLDDASSGTQDGGRDGGLRLPFTSSLSIPAFAGRKLRIPGIRPSFLGPKAPEEQDLVPHPTYSNTESPSESSPDINRNFFSPATPSGRDKEADTAYQVQRSTGSRFARNVQQSAPSQSGMNLSDERTEVQRSMQSLRNLISETHPRSRLGRMASGIPAAMAPFKAPEAVVENRPHKRTIPNIADEPEFLDRLHRVEKHIRKNNLRATFTDQLGRTGALDEVASLNEAHQLAFYLFWNIKPNFDRNYITTEDLHPFLDDDQAAEAMSIFDVDKNNQVTLTEMRMAVVGVYKNRMNLSATLKDTKTVVSKLERAIGTVLHLVFVLFYLTIWNVNFQHVWVTFGSMLLSFTFIFGNSIKTLFESVVFLFVVHPFDVGDMISIGTTPGDPCTVEEIALLSTSLVRWDGCRIVYPNSKMATDQLINLTLSGPKGDTIRILVDITTPKAFFDRVEVRVRTHVKASPVDFTGDCAISCDKNAGNEPLKIVLVVWWSYAFNGASPRLGDARTGLFLAICEEMLAAGVQYSLPTTTINLTNPAAAAQLSGANGILA